MSVFRHQICLLCHEPLTTVSPFSCLCANCARDLSNLYHSATNKCPICAKASIGNVVCGACQKETVVDRLWASLAYQVPIPALLHEFKHLKQIAYGQLFAQLMMANPPIWLPESEIDGVLAMPLSVQRRVFRGFNQCDELARYLADFYHLPLLPADTVQRLHRVPQSTLKKEQQRKQNIRSAFRVLNQQNVKNRKILIIEDVMTTGATIFELARTLRKSEASQIYVWLLARNM